jgi:hypothetical protein
LGTILDPFSAHRHLDYQEELSHSSLARWVSAILVVVADKGKPHFAWLALIPTLLFLTLDAYYLGLEHAFRDSYNRFIRKLHERTLTQADLFVVAPMGRTWLHLLRSLRSFSVWPFYGALLVLIYLAQRFVI